MRSLLYSLLIFLVFTSCHHDKRHNHKPFSKEVVAEEQIPTTSHRVEGAELSGNIGVYIPDGYETVKMKGGIPEQIINRKSYICSYNKATRSANWVGWYLSAEHADGDVKRRNMPYLEDDDSIKGKQLLSDWDDIDGYDHGHMCPSGDNKWDREAMRQTFYLSNMCVQQSQLNQGTWERLEATSREWAKKFGGIYIVCGPVFTAKPIKKIGGNLSVPDKFFKVVLCLKGKDNKPQALGFIYQNVKPAKGERLESHVVSVDQVEKLTGMDFFSKLPDDVENKIEAEPDIKKWRIY